MPFLNKRRDNKPKRGNKADKSFYNYRWAQYSRNRLKKHRLCVICQEEGIITIARVTDHIVPMSEGGSEWDDSNHQSLCIAHHNSKTAKEKHGK